MADPEIARLFDHLVPDVAGRRTGPEIMRRIYRKWHLARSLRNALQRIQTQVEAVAQLRGPALEVLDRLDRQHGGMVPATVADLRLLIDLLGESGTPAGRIELDMGFSRGIGFYSQMIFELTVETPAGPLEIGGGGRYDGLARVLGSDRDDRGVGFAFGLERLDQALLALEISPPQERTAPGGCLVVALADHLTEAASLVADLRRIAAGAWEDGGPIVGPELLDTPGPEAAGAARLRAERQGRSTFILVTGRRIDSEKVLWYRREAGGWVEEPARPAILLAAIENARKGAGQV